MSQPASRAPSQDRVPGPAPQREFSRGRSRSRRSPSIASAISDSGSEEAPQARSQGRRRRRNAAGKRQGGGLPAVDEVGGTGKQLAGTAGNPVNTVGQTAGAVTGGGGGGGGGGGDKPLKLRLDLNLYADIRLTAKVHGDLTLALLR